MKKIAVASLVSVLASQPLFAAECNGLNVATGKAGKGYSKMFANLKAVCGSQVAMCEVATSGGLDNLNALSIKQADVGFAQMDTVLAMKNGDENIASLQAVAGLNFNYLHVVTLANGFTVPGAKKYGGMVDGDPIRVIINKFSDLKRRSVAVVGSAQLLGRQLDRQLNYGMSLVDVETDDEAFKLVKAGKVAAAFTVSGWPSGTVGALTQASGLSLVPFDAPTSGAYQVRPVNYKGLGVYNNNSLAIPNVLLTRPFKGEKAKSVQALRACLSSKLMDLQEGSYEPGWNEIKNLDNTFGVAKFTVGAGK